MRETPRQYRQRSNKPLPTGNRSRVYHVWVGNPYTREVSKVHTFENLSDARKYAAVQEFPATVRGDWK